METSERNGIVVLGELTQIERGMFGKGVNVRLDLGDAKTITVLFPWDAAMREFPLRLGVTYALTVSEVKES